jgi:outer membrane lipase/esterase
MRRVVRCASLGVLGSLAMASSLLIGSGAEGQTPGRIITFGDSLSDNGNLFATTGQPPAPYNKRFTNGIVWTEILSGGAQNSFFQGTGVGGNTNLAFGGSRTDNAANLNGPIPSIPTEIITFFAVGGKIGPNDLVTLQGGPNNIFQYFTIAGPGATVPGITTTSVSAANDLSASATQLTAAGARRILVGNIPDIGATPSFNGSPTTSGAATLATNIYNAQLDANIRALAAANPGTNYIQMDWNALFRAVNANAAAFGYTNTTSACISTPACVTGSKAIQNQFVFWDGVHPTQTGHIILAQYAGLLINPQQGAARSAPLGEVASYARLNAADEVLDRASGWARGVYGRENGFYAQLTGTHGQQDANGPTPSYNFTLGGARFGLDRRFGSTLVGGALGVQLGEIGGGNLKSDVAVYDGDLYVTNLFGPVFVTGQVGGSLTQFDSIKRATGIGPITSDALSAHAHQFGANLESGVIFKSGALSIVPSARVGYINANVGSFSEKSELLAMGFEDRTISSGTAAARLRAVHDMAFGRFGGTVFGEVGYEKFFSQSTDAITSRFINNTAHATSTTVSDLSARGLNFKVGVDGKINQTMALSFQYGLSLEDGNGQIHIGQARVKVPF